MNGRLRLTLLAAPGIFMLAIGSSIVTGQETVWEVPEDARAMENPLPAEEDIIADAAVLYGRRCQMCHGETGKGDGPATRTIKPAPNDITTAEARDRMTDGEIFYKIETGKRPMPAQKGKMTEDDIWSLVHFVRSLQVSDE